MQKYEIKDYSWDSDGDLCLSIKGFKVIDMKIHLELEKLINDYLIENVR